MKTLNFFKGAALYTSLCAALLLSLYISTVVADATIADAVEVKEKEKMEVSPIAVETEQLRRIPMVRLRCISGETLAALITFLLLKAGITL